MLEAPGRRYPCLSVTTLLGVSVTQLLNLWYRITPMRIEEAGVAALLHR
jgi:hypothetical protein